MHAEGPLRSQPPMRSFIVIMAKLLATLLAIVLCLPSPCHGANTCTCESSRSALTAFFQKTGGASAWLAPWPVDIPTSSVCNWTGILCYGDGVTSLVLTDNGLTGTIPGDLIVQMPLLRNFAVSFNSLTGTLPPELSRLANLVNFDVSYNNLSGTLPSTYSAWQNLESFSVARNNFSGALPPSYHNWTSHFEQFHASGNNLTSTLPAEYSRWGASLNTFHVVENNLYGTLPDSWKNFTNMTIFGIDNNPHLTGTLPPSYGQWTAVNNFTVMYTNISGTVPPEYVAWNRSIQILFLSNTFIGGTLPSFLGYCSAMQQISISETAFVGTIPSEWASMTLLTSLSSASNGLSGTLPAQLGQWVNMRTLSLSSNQLTGTLPPSWAGMKLLTALYLDLNHLTGTLPLAWSALVNLQKLTLTFNSLSGELPQSWGALRLQVFLLQENELLTGPVPVEWKSILGTVPFGIGLMSICGTSICGASSSITGIYPLGFGCLPGSAFVSLLAAGLTFDQIYMSLLGKANFTSSVACPSTPAPPVVASRTIAPPLPPPVSAAVTAATGNAVGTLVWVGIGGSLLVPSGALGSFGAVAGLQASLAAIRLRRRCADLSDPSDGSSSSGGVATLAASIAENPTTLQLSGLGDDNAAAGGSIVGNAALVLGVGCVLHVLAGFVRPALSRCVSSNGEQDRDEEEGGDGGSAGGAAAIRRAGSFVLGLVGKDMLPGVLVGPYAAVVQPSITSAVVLLASPSSAVAFGGAITLGAAGMVLWASPIALWGYQLQRPPMAPLLWCTTPPIAMKRKKRGGGGGCEAWLHRLRPFLGPIEQWVAKADKPMRKRSGEQHTLTAVERVQVERRFGPLFLPFRQRTHWFLLVDASFAVITAVISGAASSVPDADACDAALWGGWLLVAAAVAQLAVHAVLRPMNCWFDFVVVLIGDVLAVIGNLCAVLDAIAASTYLALASSCVVLAASCFMIVVALAELILEILHGDSYQPSITLSRHMIQERVDVSHSSEQGGGILKLSAKPTHASLEMKALLEMLRDGHTVMNVDRNLKHLIRLACKDQRDEDANGRDHLKERQVKGVSGKRKYTAGAK